jgi:hypothetical protein
MLLVYSSTRVEPAPLRETRRLNGRSSKITLVFKRGLKSREAIGCPSGATTMRTMNIAPFPKRVEISDVKSLTDARLAEKFSLSEQAAALAEYMFHPANEEARISLGSQLRSSADPLRLNLKGMRRIQYRWLRVADVFHLYYDMAEGGHQSRRGGATISKAAHLAAKNTKSLGTSEATFWDAWTAYKDGAPLVTAAILIWANTRIVFTGEYVAAFRTHEDAEPIEAGRLTPFHMVLLMPDLVLAVARSFEKFALTISGRPDAGLDPETLWRIPENVNVAPVPRLSVKSGLQISLSSTDDAPAIEADAIKRTPTCLSLESVRFLGSS